MIPLDVATDPPRALVTQCGQLQAFLPDADCAGVPKDVAQEFALRFGAVPRYTATTSPESAIGAILVAAPASTTYADIVAALGSGLPALNIEQLAKTPPLAAPFLATWLAVLGVTATLLLILTAAHAFANRLLAAAPEDRLLVLAGADLHQVECVQRWTVLSPLLVSILAGGCAGLIYLRLATPMDQALLAPGFVAILIAVCVAIAVPAAFLAMRQQRVRWTAP